MTSKARGCERGINPEWKGTNATAVSEIAASAVPSANGRLAVRSVAESFRMGIITAHDDVLTIEEGARRKIRCRILG
jgi:hypothetical protein